LSSTKLPCPTPGCANLRHSQSKRCAVCAGRPGNAPKFPVQAAPEPSPAAMLAADREKARSETEKRGLKERYKAAQATIERLEQELHIVQELQDGMDVRVIEPVESSGGNEATVVVVASDWHYAGHVGPEVGGLNTFNVKVADERILRFFRKALSLTGLLATGVPIHHMVLALLGDFITGHIHEEFQETNTLPPMFEVIAVQSQIASGIQYLLDNSDLHLTIPCHSGNHARTTKTTRFGAENGHSLEYLMFINLKNHFRNEPRVTFIVPEAPHSYLDVYGTVIRFQHGHMVKFGGGVGGLTIPLNKAIAQWNQGRHADLDVLGHFHQLFDGGRFIVNGSLIGYDSFALSIKASYEKPKQALFLMDRKRGRTFTVPILL
jgi:hypothetical protein